VTRAARVVARQVEGDHDLRHHGFGRRLPGFPVEKLHDLVSTPEKDSAKAVDHQRALSEGKRCPCGLRGARGLYGEGDIAGRRRVIGSPDLASRRIARLHRCSARHHR